MHIPAGGTIGLPSSYTCYVGNAIGDVGNSTTDFMVSVADQGLCRINSTVSGAASITNAYDINRDKTVGVADQGLARMSSTTAATALQRITVP